MPATRSAIELPTLTGGPAAKPARSMTADSAWITESDPSPPANGGQLRVSSPLPGSSSLITSAPMSPSIMAQKGPARTRVRSRTRIPASGPLGFATGSSFPGALREALRDRAHPLTGAPGAAPEEPRAVERAEVREVVNVADRFDGDPGADAESLCLVAVADEPGAADQIDERDVQRRAEARGWREQGGERDDLAAAHHGGRRHLDRMARTPAHRRRRDQAALGTSGGREMLDQL